MSFWHRSTTHIHDVRSYLRAYRPAFWVAVGSVGLIVAMVALLVWRLAPLVSTHPYLPLHYNIYLGVDRFGPWYHILLLPVLSVVFLVLNLSIAAQISETESHAFRLRRRDPLLARLCVWVTPFVQLSLAAGVVFTLLLSL